MRDENFLHVFSRSPELFESLLDGLPNVLVYVKDMDGRYVWGNRTLVERSGVGRRSQLPGKTADDLFPCLGSSTLKQDLEIVRSARPARELLRCYRTNAGQNVWCISSKFPMFDAARNVIGLVGLSNDLPRPAERHHSYRRLARFLEYMDEHLEENLRICDAAKHAALSVDALTRLVLEVFHQTPKQLVMRKRLERACRLLEDGARSITEVSGACGYADHSAFTRHFKARTSITPGQYRASCKPGVVRLKPILDTSGIE